MRGFLQYRRSFQNDRFVRGFGEISKKKLPKGSFCARLPPNFIEQSFQYDHFARSPFKFSQNNASKTQSLTTPGQCGEQFQELKLCISPQFRAIGPPNPTRGFIQQNLNACYLQRRAIQNFNMYVSLEQHAQKCMNPAHDGRGNPQRTKITILPQFRTSDQHEVTRGLRRPLQNLHFTTGLDVR